MIIELNENRYKIKFVSPKSKFLLIDDEYVTGKTDFINKVIYIAKDLNEHTFKYTLLHELTHATIDSFGFLQVGWDNEIVSDFMANYSTLISQNYNYIISILHSFDD
jgi:hypothetical protein